MRSLRKLLLLAVMAGAVLAVTAPSASALEVAREAAPGAHCPAITGPVSHTPHNLSGSGGVGGCPIRAVSEAPVELGSGPIMILCDNAFEARINEAGVGYIYDQSLTNCAPNEVVPCEEPLQAQVDVWPVRLTSETSMEAQFCVDVHIGGSVIRVECHLNPIAITESPTHRYEFATTGHQACEAPVGATVEGHWNQVVNAVHPAVEIRD